MLYQIEGKDLSGIKEEIEDLDRLLTERISDLHEVSGGMQARHAYVYYRSLLWHIKYSIRDNIKESPADTPVQTNPNHEENTNIKR